MHQISLVRQET